jgi:hypothetical protein
MALGQVFPDYLGFIHNYLSMLKITFYHTGKDHWPHKGLQVYRAIASRQLKNANNIVL